MEITTQYSAYTIPALTIIMIFVSVVLLIAFAAGIFILLRKRGEHWGYALIMGMLVYMICGYLLGIGTNWAITKIWGEDAVAENQAMVSVILIAAEIIYECVGMYVGMMFVFRTNLKRNLSFDITSAIFLGLGYYIASLLLSNTLMYNFEYGMTAISINQMGFDQAVSTLVENGVAEADATESILGLCTQNSFLQLLDAFTYMLKTFVVVSSCAAIYGVMREKLGNIWLVFAFGFEAAAFIPSVISKFVSMPDWAAFLIMFLIIAAGSYLAYWMLKKYMPEEVESLQRIHETKDKDDNGRGGLSGLFGGKKEEPKKMPKIVMPKDD